MSNILAIICLLALAILYVFFVAKFLEYADDIKCYIGIHDWDIPSDMNNCYDPITCKNCGRNLL